MELLTVIKCLAALGRGAASDPTHRLSVRGTVWYGAPTHCS